ncbi:MAG TPA: metal-sensing transcriptional repressor [Hypericibacter adhaerens]|jgi:DNA-binding FrmR family transcriptional regulator|uniref:metal-sensing transcriptional repressor n=1 Tax=Hypericibacter adhaerens TaxID=2602016 RepID=UPI002D1947E4|nr:metal-sensing transcriptional repressor [Hypericibacter adhaerens]HWA45172.1 metal-sensing transcriptional repressor [Hypericibacter adhaerens]
MLDDHVTGARAGSSHASHPEVLKRLKRAQGHLATVMAMIEADRGCLEIAQQLQAVESAIGNAKRLLVHDHIDNCIERAAGPISRGTRSALEEFKAIARYL